MGMSVSKFNIVVFDIGVSCSRPCPLEYASTRHTYTFNDTSSPIYQRAVKLGVMISRDGYWPLHSRDIAMTVRHSNRSYKEHHVLNQYTYIT